MASKRRAMLKHGFRVFACGCVQRREEDMRFTKSGWKPVCAVHGEPVVAVEVKCRRCGKVEHVRPLQSQRKVCNECRALENPGPAGRPDRCRFLSVEQKIFIEENPYKMPSEIAEKLGVTAKQVGKYQRELGISWGANGDTGGREAVKRFIEKAAARLFSVGA